MTIRGLGGSLCTGRILDGGGVCGESINQPGIEASEGESWGGYTWVHSGLPSGPDRDRGVS